MSSYAIVGSGGLGGFYGGCLARGGHDVHFLIRDDLETVRQQGWRVDSAWGDFTIQNPNVYHLPEQIQTKCDFVIVSIKSTQNHLLHELLPPLLAPHTVAIVLQNGLHVERDTEEIVGPNRVIGGCCFLCSNKEGPGHIRHLDYGRIEFGAYLGLDSSTDGVATNVLRQVESDFCDSGIPVEVAANLQRARWRKLMWNIPFNGLSVALNASTAEIMQDPNSKQLAWDLMQEVQASAAALGLDVGGTHAETLMTNTEKMVPYDSSMRLDFLAGRPMELEYIFAKPIEAAKVAGYLPSKTVMLYQQLCFLQSKHRN